MQNFKANNKLITGNSYVELKKIVNKKLVSEQQLWHFIVSHFTNEHVKTFNISQLFNNEYLLLVFGVFFLFYFFSKQLKKKKAWKDKDKIA